jgi:hypothetical protein
MNNCNFVTFLFILFNGTKQATKPNYFAPKAQLHCTFTLSVIRFNLKYTENYKINRFIGTWREP